jgi:hypothetical protein
MAIRRDHEVAAIIWENIHDDKTALTLKQYKMFFVIARFWQGTENALVGFVFGDVFHAPGRPNAFHKTSVNYQFD